MGVANISGNLLNDTGLSLSSYLPLTGGTLTGALNGTSATFSSSVNTSGPINITVPYSAGTMTFLTQDNLGNGIYLAPRSNLNFDYGVAGNTTGIINQFGYQNGSAHFRSLQIGNGKGGSIAFFDGTTSNVGIGTSSPLSLLDVCVLSSGARRLLVNYDDSLVTIKSANSGGTGENLRVWGDNIYFYTGSATGTERMRITSGGIVYALNSGVDGTYQPMIGGMYSSNNNETNLISTAVSSVASSSGFRFDVSNGGGSTGRTAVFWITRSGFNSNVNGESVIVDNNPSNSGSRRVLTVQGGIFGSSGDSSSKLIIFQANNGTELGSVQRNGGANVVYNTSSDRRLKEDYKDFNGLDLVKNVKVYDFKWKGGEHRNYGVIADELQEVVPSIVSGTKDETYEDGRDKYMGVDYGQLTPILVKAIQELSAKVTALENK